MTLSPETRPPSYLILLLLFINDHGGTEDTGNRYSMAFLEKLRAVILILAFASTTTRVSVEARKWAPSHSKNHDGHSMERSSKERMLMIDDAGKPREGMRELPGIQGEGKSGSDMNVCLT